MAHDSILQQVAHRRRSCVGRHCRSPSCRLFSLFSRAASLSSLSPIVCLHTPRAVSTSPTRTSVLSTPSARAQSPPCAMLYTPSSPEKPSRETYEAAGAVCEYLTPGAVSKKYYFWKERKAEPRFNREPHWSSASSAGKQLVQAQKLVRLHQPFPPCLLTGIPRMRRTLMSRRRTGAGPTLPTANRRASVSRSRRRQRGRCRRRRRPLARR